MQHLFSYRGQALREVLPLRSVQQVACAQLAAGRVVPHVERAVFAHYALHRPHARKVVAPARGPAGDGDHAQAGAVQGVQRAVGGGGEPAFGGERVVDVAQQRVKARRQRRGHVTQRLQRGRNGPCTHARRCGAGASHS
jgi:hypothetical protein